MEKNKNIEIDKVKELENVSSKLKLDDNLPISVRLDGKSFKNYTKILKKPYDQRMSEIMIDTMNYLVDETDAKLGFTQSDEITLIYYKTKKYQQIFFDGKIQKLSSVLASMATAKFNFEASKKLKEKNNNFAFFDCRVWNVPTKQDILDLIINRQEDGIKNAISMAAYSIFSNQETLKKTSLEKINMLKEKSIIFEDYPEYFKSGTFSKKIQVIKQMPENLKSFKSNEGKNEVVRHEINNFHINRVKKENPEIMFEKLINDYKENLDNRKQKKPI